MRVEYETLESMCELVVDCPHSTPKWTDEGFLVLRNQNIRNGVLDLSSPSFTNQEDYEGRIRRAVPQAGDIVFTREAPMGEVCMIPEGLQCCLGQRQVLLRPKKSVNGEYLFWALQSPFVQHQISWNEGTGSTVSNVRIPVLKALKIPRNGSAEAAIAKVLSDIASKIENNRQANQTLEQIAQAIFKSWFVDFEPTRAKIITKDKGANPATQELAAQAIICGAITLEQLADVEQNLETTLQQTIDKKLNQHNQTNPAAQNAQQLKATAALFPNELVESELGDVPEGWRIRPFSEYAKITKGKNITKKNAVPGDVPVVAGGLLPAYWHNVHNVEGPAITISASGANAGYVNLYNQNIWSSDSSYINKQSTSYFYTAYVCLKYYQKEIYDMQTGAAQPHIYPKDFERLNVVFGRDDLLEQLENLLFSFFEKTAVLKSEAETLTQLRDILLPKLLSGELASGTMS